ncbi:HEXXH motif domain-containing protein [Nocardia sp. NBC_00565]|uniref:HEXXH motif domain-containing protein n=1 Tax=Nocardia sp. NBC_00565 TaxID=2975993 RepID=UPI002E8113A0|nr:HEXXH motif domain-containing protein [Nocardia sp. NBC_00565]WUC02719.1 HEXXH motif domain-containing protein [Nocardia sp. NBC_00565]
MTATFAGIDDATADLSSGHGTERSIAVLANGLLTTRTILLRTAIAEITTQLPEIADRAGLSLAYQTMAELQRSHPAAVTALLSYPHTGPWLARVLHRIHAAPDDETTPLWADCGYLGWLAAAGGITCRAEGSMKLVVRNGVVMLPGIGMVRFGSAEDCGHCELRWTSEGALHFTRDTTTVLISCTDEESDPVWLPLRRLCGAADEPEVFLDDLDPFRDFLDDRTPARLTAAQAELWQQDFAAAWDLLDRDFDRYLVPMRSCLQALAPLSVRPLVASTSHTSSTGLGCVYTTAPADPCQLALSLIHEIQHTKFTLLTDQVVLVDPDPACHFYAPWRDDPRPIFGLLHGIYAFFGVTDFWRVHRHADCHRSQQAHVDFELWRIQVEAAMTHASTSGLLTDSGAQFIDTLRAGMRPWSSEDVSAEARLAASEASAAHRTFWQVRNLIPDAGGIANLAAQWTAQASRPTVLPSAGHADQQTVPDGYRRLHLSAQLKVFDSGPAGALASPDQPHGDRAYLAGDLSEAVALYARELHADPLRPQLWAGLALTMPKLYPDSNFSILNTRAEVAARLYRTVRADTGTAAIIDLVRWLSNCPDVDG